MVDDQITQTEIQISETFEDLYRRFSKLLAEVDVPKRSRIGSTTGMGADSPQIFERLISWHKAPDVMALLHLFWSSTVLCDDEKFAVSCLPSSKFSETDPPNSRTLARISPGKSECLALFLDNVNDRILVDVHFDGDVTPESLLDGISPLRLRRSQLGVPNNWSMQCTSDEFLRLIDDPRFIAALNTYLHKFRNTEPTSRFSGRHNQAFWDCVTQFQLPNTPSSSATKETIISKNKPTQKSDRFEQLSRLPTCEAVIRMNALYLSEAQGDQFAIDDSDRWALSCLPTTNNQKRLSALSIGKVEALVIFADPADPYDVAWQITSTRSAVLDRQNSLEVFMKDFPRIELQDKPFANAGADQIRIRGNGEVLFRDALKDERVLRGIVEMANYLARARTPYAHYASPMLTREILDRVAAPDIEKPLRPNIPNNPRDILKDYVREDENATYKSRTVRRPRNDEIDKYGAACNAHKKLQNRLADIAKDKGCNPKKSKDPSCDFDIGWELSDDCCVLVEVKSLRGDETGQLRLGLGQILDYAQSFETSDCRVKPVLYVEREPRDGRWVDICKRAGVVLAWPGEENRIFSAEDQLSSA